jgi:glycosyltransferase involved in cell wall biosynthesis
VVLTHNANGEYGHVHHRQVNRMVGKLWGDVVQSGFGAKNINGLVRLPEPILSRKRTLFDIYQSAGKHARMKLYPPYKLDFEPLVIPENIVLEAADKFKSPKTWKEIAGSGDLARRDAEKTYKIAVLADTRGWAHDVISRHVKRNLPPEIQLELFFLYDERFTKQLSVTVNEDDYDLIHLLSWRYWPVIKKWGFSRQKLVTTIIGHREVARDSPSFLEVMGNFACVSVVSPRLYQELSPVVPGLFLTPCGVDTQTFYPGSEKMGSDFTFGAVGRHYVVEGEYDDIKGWKKILEPLTTALRPLEAHYLRVDKAACIPYKSMPDFYNQFHCYVCASRTEGLPLPLLEAASCGLILLSTDVGIAPEIIQEGRNGRILPRDVQSFTQAIIDLSNQRGRWAAMGKHSRKIMLSGWDWWSVAPRWAEFYQAAL